MTMLDNLKPTDAFGLVLFDHRTEEVQSMQPVASLDMAALKAQIAVLEPRGSTEMVQGLLGGAQLITEHLAQLQGTKNTKSSATAASRRIMFLTDARPSSFENKKLLEVCQKLSEKDKIFTTFIGLGVDFGVELIDSISHIKGCNYFTVTSSPEFKKLMEQDLEYVVTPCCFDVDIKIVEGSSSAVRVQRVYGSPGNEIPQDGLLMRMLSGFPSAKDENGGTKGGMILAKIAPAAPTSTPRKQTLELVVTYKDVDDKKYEVKNTLEIEFGAAEEHYSNNAVRKAILLTRFVNGMKWWIKDHQTREEPGQTVCDSAGIPPPPVGDSQSNHHGSLRVSTHYKAMLGRLLNHYERATEQLLDAGDIDDHLNEHARQLVGLVHLVAAEDIRRAMAAVTTDDEVAFGTADGGALVDADVIQRRCEAELKVADLSTHHAAFETEVKRRLKNVVVARINQEGKERLKDAPRRAELVDELAKFLRDRPDQEWSQWKAIAEAEMTKLVSGAPPRRFFVM